MKPSIIPKSACRISLLSWKLRFADQEQPADTIYFYPIQKGRGKPLHSYSQGRESSTCPFALGQRD